MATSVRWSIRIAFAAALVASSVAPAFAAPAPAPARRAPAIRRAVPDTLWPDSAARVAAPRYASFVVARDSARNAIAALLGPEAAPAAWRTYALDFVYHDRPVAHARADARMEWALEERDTTVHVTGWVLQVTRGAGDGRAHAQVAAALQRAGWMRNGYYSTGGEGHASFAFECANAVAYVEASWDEPASSAGGVHPGERVLVTLVPRPADDPRLAKRRARSAPRTDESPAPPMRRDALER